MEKSLNRGGLRRSLRGLPSGDTGVWGGATEGLSGALSAGGIGEEEPWEFRSVEGPVSVCKTAPLSNKGTALPL